MPSDPLFGPASSSEAMLSATSDKAWVEAMLEVEAALARAEERVGLIPHPAAEAIVAACRTDRFDIAQLGREAVAAGNPVIPLVEALRKTVPKEAADYVHLGATSQDVLDTAMMLIARRSLDLIASHLEVIARAAAELADRHRSTVMAGRTLLQQSVPITFGLKAAGWLSAVCEVIHRFRLIQERRLAIQFGGASGTLAVLGDQGLSVMEELSRELGLLEPIVPWHTVRARVVDIATTLGLAAGTVGKIALDLLLLAQTEVAEVHEHADARRGRSSTIPQKRNPVGAVEALAAVRGVNAQVGVLLGALLEEHERSAGAWQSEWPALSEVLRLTAGVTSRVAEILPTLEVDADRMMRNLELDGGLVMSESVSAMLGKKLGRSRATDLLKAVTERVRGGQTSLRDALSADPEISRHLSPTEIDAALDPHLYVGSANAFIDRALGSYRLEVKRQ